MLSSQQSQSLTTQRVRELLSKQPGIMACSFPPGQVMIYEHHLPNGVFVILRGVLHIYSEAQLPRVQRKRGVQRGGSRRRKNTSSSTASPTFGKMIAVYEQPLLLPPPDSLEQDAPYTIEVCDTVDALFVPKSCLHVKPVARTLTRLFSISSVGA